MKIKYKGYCFKLSVITIKNLREIKIKEKLTWNLLFVKFIKKYYGK